MRPLFKYRAGADPGFGVGGTKFGKVIWEYYYYCLICLWNVRCRKIKIDLQVIMIIWGEEIEPLSLLSLSLCFLSFTFIFFMFIRDFWGFLGGGGVNLPSAPSESASAGGYTCNIYNIIEHLFPDTKNSTKPPLLKFLDLPLCLVLFRARAPTFKLVFNFCEF